MNKIIENLLLPKPKFKVGQVWGDINTNYQFVITDITFAKQGVVRGLVLGEDNFGDKFDVMLKKKYYKDILTRDRCTMRVTDGPISTKMLTQYHFSLNEKDIDKVIKSLDVEDYEFEPMQELLNAKYLEHLNVYHIAATEEMEEFLDGEQENDEEYESNTKVFIITLPLFTKKKTNYYSLALAAGSNDRKKELSEFWDKEYELYLNGKSDTILDEPKFNVRLTIIDNYVYLVFYNSSDSRLIEDIKITNLVDSTTFFASNKSLTVTDRSFTSFNLQDIKPGKYILSFVDNDIKKEFDLLINE
ncbi:MAG TPA: hypothetical protein PL041_01330 [Melioribacteraceae bacterium]|nr:hypothetical protein [Melioribacteraceae bacterium]